MGKSLVLLDTSRAVDTELGRVYVGNKPRSERGDAGDEVRNRMLRWKAKVEKVQRITVWCVCLCLLVLRQLNWAGGVRGKTEKDVRKNTYCNTIGCCARAPRLLPPDEAAPEDSGIACFSIRAHVR